MQAAFRFGVGALALVAAGCGLLIDLSSSEDEDAGARLDARGVDSSSRADAGGRGDGALRDALPGRDAGGANDGGELLDAAAVTDAAARPDAGMPPSGSCVDDCDGDGTPDDISRDPRNCGGCGIACAPGQSCCNGMCTFSTLCSPLC